MLAVRLEDRLPWLYGDRDMTIICRGDLRRPQAHHFTLRFRQVDGTPNPHEKSRKGTSTHEVELNMVRCRVRRDLRAVFAGVALGDRVAHHVEFSCDFVKVSCRAARQKPAG